MLKLDSVIPAHFMLEAPVAANAYSDPTDPRKTRSLELQHLSGEQLIEVRAFVQEILDLLTLLPVGIVASVAVTINITAGALYGWSFNGSVAPFILPESMDKLGSSNHIFGIMTLVLASCLVAITAYGDLRGVTWIRQTLKEAADHADANGASPQASPTAVSHAPAL